MTPTIQIDTREFQAAMKQYLLETSRELAAAINSRMFFLLLRAYVLVRPREPQARRNQIRTQLNEWVGTAGRVTKKGVFKRYGRNRQLTRAHLMVQGIRGKIGLKGLYGQELTEAVGRFRRARIGSVGYLKAAIVKALTAINRSSGFGGFTQFGRSSKTGSRTAANAALVRIAGDYGVFVSAGNVSVFRSAKGIARPALPGFNPVATVQLDVGVSDSQLGNVTAEYTRAFQTAYNDETRELTRHLAERAQAVADKYNAKGVAT